MAKSAEDKQVLGLSFDLNNQSLLPTQQEPPATTNQGTVIQLTMAGKEEDWDSLEDNELIFSLDKDEDGGEVIFTKEKAPSESGKNFEDGLGSTFHIPTSPSSSSLSGSLWDISYSTGFFSPETSPGNIYSSSVPKLYMKLVKSLSTELESKETTSLKPRPLLSLVKSISTEISRHEPEITQSKSDSKLNTHLWRQLTQPKGRNGDFKTAPSSPSISPSKSKGRFFKVLEVEAKLEDTKRKFSEAMQEPLSMLSKIIGEENSKQKLGASDSPGVGSQTNRDSGGDLARSKNARRGGECDRLSVWETPVRHAKKSLSESCLSPYPKCKLGNGGSKYEICTYGDVMQVVEIKPSTESTGVESGELSPKMSRELGSLQTSQPVPSKCLFCIATLAYGYFVLPLPSYMSGLCLGLACGVMVGLVVILLLVPRNSVHFARKLPSAHDCLQSELLIKEHKQPDVLKFTCIPSGVESKITQSVSVSHSSSSSGQVLYSGGSSRGGTEDIASLFGLRDLAGSVRQKIILDYNTSMAHFIMSESSSPLLSPCHSAASSPRVKTKFPSDPLGGSSKAHPAWINALIGRILWDFLREKYWADQVACKIQKKLSKIWLPYFMNELTLTGLDMGTSLPQILSTSKPSINHRGLWLDLEVTYNGLLQMTLETKMNLCKLGKKAMGDKDSLLEPGREGSKTRVYLLADSDEESSSAGSSDEEVPPTEPHWLLGDKATPPGTEGHVAGSSTSRKILRFVDKIAKSKYFQKATENEFIKKKIKEVSNTPVLLTVEVQELSGKLAVNIPPPPTDRLWYSFQIPPRLDLKVRPKLGERKVTFSHVTEWIEKKLQQEFQKVFVMPNMDDLYLPIMHSGLDNLAQSPAEP
ncbi:testis-expressed protein 2-like [Polyodon spathula]|uniref:testis-expressed protein 2-like n=1 Tax=Polyodon spathula TaxID=7913 RepID=UPI001B7E24B0|nr:testis-expressed protein 2-like [Polyodon spathula]